MATGRSSQTTYSLRSARAASALRRARDAGPPPTTSCFDIPASPLARLPRCTPHFSGRATSTARAPVPPSRVLVASTHARAGRRTRTRTNSGMMRGPAPAAGERLAREGTPAAAAARGDDHRVYILSELGGRPRVGARWSAVWRGGGASKYTYLQHAYPRAGVAGAPSQRSTEVPQRHAPLGVCSARSERREDGPA